MPAPLLFLLSGLTQYVGAAVAVRLFGTLPPTTVAWLRIAIAAVVLLAWARPWRAPLRGRRLATAAAFGVVLAAMNVSFYLAIAHLPLGTAVAVEFLGPVAVAAITGRGWRDRAAIGVALVGVVLLAGVSLRMGPGGRVGLVAILAAAVFWACYILLGRRVAGQNGNLAGLAVGMATGAVVFAPILARGAAPVLHDGRLALAVLAVAVCSSVVPYAIEQVVMRRVTAATFAVLLALLPVTAAVVGAVVLRQVPTLAEIIGTLAVCSAIALTGRSQESLTPER
ncbi:MAG TPA: EamA family transporter [Cellulomonas sp.]